MFFCVICLILFDVNYLVAVVLCIYKAYACMLVVFFLVVFVTAYGIVCSVSFVFVAVACLTLVHERNSTLNAVDLFASCLLASLLVWCHSGHVVVHTCLSCALMSITATRQTCTHIEQSTTAYQFHKQKKP